MRLRVIRRCTLSASRSVYWLRHAIATQMLVSSDNRRLFFYRWIEDGLHTVEIHVTGVISLAARKSVWSTNIFVTYTLYLKAITLRVDHFSLRNSIQIHRKIEEKFKCCQQTTCDIIPKKFCWFYKKCKTINKAETKLSSKH